MAKKNMRISELPPRMTRAGQNRKATGNANPASGEGEEFQMASQMQIKANRRHVPSMIRNAAFSVHGFGIRAAFCDCFAFIQLPNAA